MRDESELEIFECLGLGRTDSDMPVPVRELLKQAFLFLFLHRPVVTTTQPKHASNARFYAGDGIQLLAIHSEEIHLRSHTN